MTDFLVRNMSRLEFDLAIDWAASEGWNPGLNDAEPFYAADPDGYFLALDREEPVGCISAVAYGNDYGFIGFFIIRPDRRGHRAGIKLGRHALEYLEGRLIGIDGVEAQAKHYESFGFKPSYRNIRYEGSAKKSLDKSEAIVPCDQMPLDVLLDYDRRVFGWPRGAFLRLWLGQPRGQAWAWCQDGQLKGYGVVRICRKGYKIGPLFCANQTIAKALLIKLVSGLPEGSLYYLDVPEINPAAMSLAAKYHLKPVFRTVRMYNREYSNPCTKNIYGVTSFELG